MGLAFLRLRGGQLARAQPPQRPFRRVRAHDSFSSSWVRAAKRSSRLRTVGTERPTRLSQSGHQVGFNLTVVNTCSAAFQYYTGTDTVRGGKIVAAEVTRTG